MKWNREISKTKIRKKRRRKTLRSKRIGRNEIINIQIEMSKQKEKQEKNEENDKDEGEPVNAKGFTIRNSKIEWVSEFGSKGKVEMRRLRCVDTESN